MEMEMMRPMNTVCVPYSSCLSLRQMIAACASISTGAAARVSQSPTLNRFAAVASPLQSLEMTTWARLRTLMPNSPAPLSAAWKVADRLTQTSMDGGSMLSALTDVAV